MTLSFLLITYLVAVFLSAMTQIMAITDRHTERDYGIAAVLALIPVVNVLICGIAVGGLINRRMEK